MNSLVSICIPIYNSEKTIKETLESVINQTYQNIEIIIVDNCSLDNTWNIINSFKDERIKKFKNDSNIGMVGNWNKCLEYATGEYIHFLCGDDLLAEDCIEKKIKLAERDDNIHLIFSASEIINEKNQILMKRRQYKKNTLFDGNKLAKTSFLTKNLFGEPSNVLFKRRLIASVGCFSTILAYTCDWEMWIRLSVNGIVGYISDSLMQYRISTVNETSSLSTKQIFEDDKIFINLVIKNKILELNIFTVLIHKAAYFLRFCARKIIMKIWCQ